MHALETSRLLTEEYTAKILLATMGKPKSAFDLSEKLNIPIAACYRKIRVLEDAGLLICDERKLTRAGKRMSVYRSRVLNAQIIFEKNKVKARLQMIDGTVEDYNYDVESNFVMDSVRTNAIGA
ncbi:MAG: helix-turn-helix domain-containing protein [Methanomassiliicoccales archaeon]|nr:helix-turn-helix domain-containing protein [Methanomassiliicoccales archaeon]